MKRAWLVAIAIGCGSSHVMPERGLRVQRKQDVAAFDPGVPALRLPRHFLPIRYLARLAIDPAKTTFDGSISIEGALDRRSAAIWLHGDHLAITSAKASDGTREITLAVTPHGDMLELRPTTPLDAGTWTLALAYRGTIVTNSLEGAFVSKVGDDPYVITQFEAIAARLVFPCFDEPDFKVLWQLTLDVPKGQVAVSNTPPTGTTAIDATHERIAFAETRPLPSYLVAFAVGPFEIIDAGKSKSGVPLRVITPRGTKPQAAFLASAAAKIVDTLETWFQIPYPYPKLDYVVAPHFDGAMENAGMIVGQAGATLVAKPTASEKREIVALYGHETSHQWFGDLVTADWWDDIWLNESFATWIEDKVVVAFDKTWPTEVDDHRVEAFGADELVTARKIHQPIASPADIHNAFDSITYPKGALVLRMLEHQLGETAFQSAIQHYLAAHTDGNATAADLFGALDDVAGKPLGVLATGWFDQGGVPEVAMDLTCDGSGRSRLSLTQQRYLPNASQPSDQLWTIPLCVAFEGPNKERLEQCTVLATESTELELPTCPYWFAPAGDYGYFHAKLDEKALEGLRDHGWDKLTHDERIAIYRDVSMYASRAAVSLTLWWSLAHKLATGHDDRELAVGIELPGAIVELVPLDLLPATRAKMRVEYERLAKTTGLVPHGDEPVQHLEVRERLIRQLDWARSHVLDAEAKKLVAHYRDLPFEEIATVARVASNADDKLATKLLADLTTERDVVIHSILVSALSEIHEPAVLGPILEAIIHDPTSTPDDLSHIWRGGGEEPRAVREAYLRAHWDEVVKRMPPVANQDFPDLIRLAAPFLTACDPARRDELVAFVTQHLGSIPTLKRPIAQDVELMDNCIARKKLLEPSLRAWLTAKP